MGKNILTTFFELKKQNTDKNTLNKNIPKKNGLNKNNRNRKKYKHKSKIMRKSKKNKSTTISKHQNRNINIHPIEILKRSPKTTQTTQMRGDIKNPVKSSNLRKSMNTSKKCKRLKRTYFDMWNSSPDKTQYNIAPTSNINSRPPMTLFSDSDILDKLSKMSFNKHDKDDKETIEAMRIILASVKDENDRIEKLLKGHLNLEEPIEEEKEDPTIYKCIKKPMTTIRELIEIGDGYDKYKDDDDTYFNIDLKALHNMKEPLESLDSMIGLKDVKDKIIEHILFYIQHLEDENNDFLHTTLYGNPGVGKTELGRIIGKIYSSLGFLSSGHVIEAHAEDFIGSVVGQTALKTRSILDKALGGVLVIDEAYALGNKNGKSYVEDFISTLLPFLTEHRNNFVCILMGYKKDIEDNLFSKNKGLRRRFPNIYAMRDYNTKELRSILIKKIKEYGWYYDNDSIPLDAFNKCKKNHDNIFEDNGGSMENLFKHTKRAHSKRVLYYPPEKKKTINKNDFENGLKSYLESIQKETDEVYKYMYS
jgi:hypothetical protein